MHAGQHDHIGIHLRRLARQGQAVADNVRDAVENFRRLVIVRENDGAARALELLDGVHILLHGGPFNGRDDVADALIDRIEGHLLPSFILKMSISYDAVILTLSITRQAKVRLLFVNKK